VLEKIFNIKKSKKCIHQEHAHPGGSAHSPSGAGAAPRSQPAGPMRAPAWRGGGGI